VRWQLSLARLGTTVPHYQSPANLALEYTDLGKLGFQSRVDYTLADATPNNHDDNLSAYDSAGRLSSYRYTAVSPSNVNYTHTFTSSYEGWEGWVEKTVAGTSNDSNYKPITNTLSYDNFGRLIKQQEHTEYQSGAIDDRMRAYSNTAEGQVQSRRDGTWKQVNSVWQFVEGDADPNTGATPNYGFVYSGGTQVAELAAGSRARANMPTHSILGVNGSGGYAAGGGTVAALQGEDLRSLAQRVYGTSSLWYVLADANGLSDPDKDLTAGVQLKAPSMGVNGNDANTFRPYDPNEAIGGTSPSLPYIAPPSVGNCGMIVRVFAVIVAAVVAYYTWDPGTTFSVYAAIVGAGGEAVAQTIEIGEGARQGYSAAGIVGAGLGAGFGGASGIDNIYANAAVMAASSYTSNYTLSKVFNEEAHFSWRQMLGQVAAAVVTVGVFGNKNPAARELAETGQSAGQSVANVKFNWKEVAAYAAKEFGKNLGREVVGGYVNAAITGDKYRFDGRHTFASAAANAFGNTAIMAGNGAFRVPAEEDNGYTLSSLYEINRAFGVPDGMALQEGSRPSMGGVSEEHSYAATVGARSQRSRADKFGRRPTPPLALDENGLFAPSRRPAGLAKSGYEWRWQNVIGEWRELPLNQPVILLDKIEIVGMKPSRHVSPMDWRFAYGAAQPRQGGSSNIVRSIDTFVRAPNGVPQHRFDKWRREGTPIPPAYASRINPAMPTGLSPSEMPAPTNMYQPRVGPWESAYLGYADGMENAPTVFGKIFGGLGAAGTVIPGLFDMTVSAVYNAPNNAGLMGQSLAKGSVLRENGYVLDSNLAYLESIYFGANSASGFGVVATPAAGVGPSMGRVGGMVDDMIPRFPDEINTNMPAALQGEVVRHSKVIPNKLESHELVFADQIVEYRGGQLVGAETRSFPGIDGHLDGIPISLKETKGGLGAVVRHASQAEAKAAKAGYSGVDLYVKAPNVNSAALIDFSSKGPLLVMPRQGIISNIFVLTRDGWVMVGGR
jgi:hypothetical protein